MKVRIGYGLGLHAADPAVFTAVVDALEGEGLDSLWLSERVTAALPDPLSALAFAAGRTRRLKIGTSVLVLPGRNPVLLAKELATLDQLSRGRLLPALGLGTPEPAELSALGVERAERSAWFDEALPLIRRLWTGEAVDWPGPRFPLAGVAVAPRPWQDPPDVWLGGHAPSELRRTGRLGDGWLAGGVTPAEADAGRVAILAAAEDARRRIDPEHFGVIVPYATRDLGPDGLEQLARRRRGRPAADPRDLAATGRDGLPDLLTRFVAVGISKFVLVPLVPPDDWAAEIRSLARTVLPLQTSLSS